MNQCIFHSFSDDYTWIHHLYENGNKLLDVVIESDIPIKKGSVLKAYRQMMRNDRGYERREHLKAYAERWGISLR
jgi:hypothetical protein